MGMLSAVGEAIRRGITAEAPVDLFPRSRTLGRGGTSSGGGVSKSAALSVVDWQPDIYAIVEAQATAQSKLTWRLYRSAASGRVEDRVEVPQHPAKVVWDRPNRFYTQADLVEALANHYELTGEQWLTIGRARGFGMPIELWPVRPDLIAPIPHPREFISGYLYSATGSPRDAVELGVDDVIVEMRRHPKDPLRGMSPLAAAMLTARADREAQRYNAEFFENDATPGGIVWLPEQIPEPAWTEFRKRWAEQHQGPGQRHRIHFADNMKDAKFEGLPYTQKDMQFTELHRVSVEGFMRAYRMSDFVLGMLRDVNRAAAEAAMVWFGITHVIPRADRTRRMLNQKFLPLFGPQLGQGYEWDYDDPIPPDRAQAAAEQAQQLDLALQAIAAGVPSDEAFEFYGLPQWELEEPEPVEQVEDDPAGDETEDEDEDSEGLAAAARAGRRRARARRRRPRISNHGRVQVRL
jgi:HK97 family phage portal protein